MYRVVICLTSHNLFGKPESALLFMADSAAYPKARYYQDTAIRACFEKILICEQNRQPARILLSLATGAGKTVIAANPLWRLHQAQRLPKPALFLYDRDELREQATTNLKRSSATMHDSSPTAKAKTAPKIQILAV